MMDSHILSYFQTMFLVESEKGPMDFLNVLEGQVIETIKIDLSKEYLA